jgi:hypothetical protein
MPNDPPARCADEVAVAPARLTRRGALLGAAALFPPLAPRLGRTAAHGRAAGVDDHAGCSWPRCPVHSAPESTLRHAKLTTRRHTRGS